MARLVDVSILPLGAVTEPDDDDPDILLRWVYQRVGENFGNLARHTGRALQRRRHVIPADPRTPLQIALRARLGAAAPIWRSMDATARSAYQADAAARSITPYMAFVSAYCLANPIDPSTFAVLTTTPTAGSAWAALGAPNRLATVPANSNTVNLAQWPEF